MRNTRFTFSARISRAFLAALLLTAAAIGAALPLFKTSGLRLSSVEETGFSHHFKGGRE